MIRMLSSTLRNATSSQLCQGWGSVLALSVGEVGCRFNGGKIVSQGIDIAMTGGFNPESLPRSGRGRVILKPA